MYCKMYGNANGAILKKNNVCKILVDLYSAILVRFSIFSIQVALIVRTYRTCINTILSTGNTMTGPVATY